MTVAAGEKLYEQMTATYAALLDSAEDLGNGTLLFTGSVSAVMAEAKIKNQYSIILAKLESMDCIQRLQRGNAYQPSRIALYKEPTWKEFEASGPTYGGKGKASAQQQQINDLNRRVTNLEYAIERLEMLNDEAAEPTSWTY